ncbi:MAG: hypothetical protein JST24_06680 [Acidobacteria bacterium]|nr:hypothetical protein [Acidobacteriota bacterium]
MKPKNVLFIALVIIVTAGAVLGIKYAIDAHAAAVALQAKIQNQKWIGQLMNLNSCGALTTEEQTRLDNAGDDPFKVQTALIQIHQNRANFWIGQLKDAADRQQKLDNLLASEPSLAFYQASQVADTRAKIKSDATQAAQEEVSFEVTLKSLKAWRPLTDKEQAEADKKRALDAKTTDPKA